MKKSRILILFVVLFSVAIFVSGCNKNKDLEEDIPTTVAGKLAYNFKNEIKKENDIKKVATTLSNDEVIKTKVEVFDIKDGDYISGFETQIEGFKNAVGVRPIIGTIPFIMYIFEVENASDFAKNLENNAQLNWNICTEADEMKTAISGDYVFFVMSPSEFQ